MNFFKWTFNSGPDTEYDDCKWGFILSLCFCFPSTFSSLTWEYQTLETYIKIFSLGIYLWLQKIKQCTYFDDSVNTRFLPLRITSMCTAQLYNLQTDFIKNELSDFELCIFFNPKVTWNYLVHLSWTSRYNVSWMGVSVSGSRYVSNCPLYLIFISRTRECAKITKFQSIVPWFLRNYL